MRLLHTSDWHLGRSFHGFDLREAQERYLDHLVEVVVSERIDAVLVAGDVYDRAIPSLDAVALLDDALTRIAQHAQIVIIAGNHDSARRLSYGGNLLARAGVHMRTRIDDIARPVLLDNGAMTVAVHAVPFLEPFTSSPQLLEDDGDRPTRSHQAVLASAMQRVAQHRVAGRSVLMSHAWYAGGEASESEVDVSIGGVGQASTALLDGFDYVALGHLHKPQAIDEYVRYSGSPIMYSFSERGTSKRSFIVDLGGASPVITEIGIPSHREVAAIEGSIDELLSSSAYGAFEQAFLRVDLTDLPVPMQAMNRLRERFPFIAELRTRTVQAGGLGVQEIRTKTPLEICDQFLVDVRGAGADSWEREQLQQAIERARRDEVAS